MRGCWPTTCTSCGSASGRGAAWPAARRERATWRENTDWIEREELSYQELHEEAGEESVRRERETGHLYGEKAGAEL